MLHSTFVLLFRYWRCSDQLGQWIPFTTVIVTLNPIARAADCRLLLKKGAHLVSETRSVRQGW
jgi:hypothetical protein